MSRRSSSSTTEQTKDALPHEMAALERAAAGAGGSAAAAGDAAVECAPAAGGTNRADQDLSALFDKELQRQQRTNYETRPAGKPSRIALSPTMRPSIASGTWHDGRRISTAASASLPEQI